MFRVLIVTTVLGLTYHMYVSKVSSRFLLNQTAVLFENLNFHFLKASSLEFLINKIPSKTYQGRCLSKLVKTSH